MTEKIKTLRNERVPPDEIESLILARKLGEIWIDNGYQYIGGIQVSWLIVEVHNPGFIEWMEAHPREYVVHHEDGNSLNNLYSNLQVMSRGDHIRLHDIEWWRDPANTEAIKAMKEKISKTERKNNGWVDVLAFEKPFTVRDYAKVSDVGYSRAGQRLAILLREGQITCEKMTVDERRRNVYRRNEDRLEVRK